MSICIRRRQALGMACATFLAQTAWAAEPAPAVAVVVGKTLRLVASGYRYKGPFKVNLIELYAQDRFASLDELARQDGPKRIAMTLQQEVSSNFLGKSLTRGIEDNVAKGDLAPLVPALVRMGELFNEYKSLASGSKVLIDFVPGTGTVITINGVQAGEPFREPTLFRAILSIWLGPVPVDFRLKDTLLGVR
ncbi:chalcone isomerase family protein [Curvibacter sp. APW13]|uniref:chalcone isomerase family protein n=1 Tax=Curvibacter sp. APW13 TaxID=3077236 RepID=UPI0028E05AE7|nr:chalcone isomerase family protein [Curvibacter sp. APW13]MDT8990951.1 chalcone isomerase family protein [Curvibacter sp. APW13]